MTSSGHGPGYNQGVNGKISPAADEACGPRVATFARRIIARERSRALRPASSRWPFQDKKPWTQAAEPAGKWLQNYRLHRSQTCKTASEPEGD